MNCRRGAQLSKTKEENWQDKNLMIQIGGGVYRVAALPQSDNSNTRD
jgi:hypothetical protein